MATYQDPARPFKRTPSVQSMQMDGITNLALLAPIEEGFVESIVPVTHAQRSQAVLKVLHALRQASRESRPVDARLPDFVGALEIVHFFRFGVIPGDLPQQPPGSATGPARMYLNVTFDGGWEPYMRFIWRDLGALLDLIMCSCVDYPNSRLHRYDDYIRWVRAHEVPDGFFYADSGLTVGDKQRLRKSRLRPGPPLDANVLRGLKLVEALSGLRALFMAPADSVVLRRAAQELVGPVVAQKLRSLLTDNSPESRLLVESFEAPLRWFEPELPPSAQAPAPPATAFMPARSDIQGGILSSYPAVTHGCLALLQVTDRKCARAFLAGWPVNSEARSTGATGTVFRNVALTHPGFMALGIPDAVRDRLPQEFLEGMDMRAGALGDCGVNHPQNWTLPQVNWPVGPATLSRSPVDLRSVHIVAQLRVNAPDAPRGDQAVENLPAELLTALRELENDSGLRILSVQPMYRNVVDGSTMPREHFGFQDGFSQPSLDDRAHAIWSDRVSAGEILLGQPNQRGDKPLPDGFFDNGTFLAIRKLKQHVAALNAAIEQHGDKAASGNPTTEPTLLEQMVGRRRDGQPLAAQVGDGGVNDFDFSADADGAQCPMQSHIRRANPRRNQPHAVPRIMRRGMSYGPQFSSSAGSADADRGTVFIAYCASLAEQFEVIQRWIGGGNSSGLSSAQRDPLMGVPKPGEANLFSCRLGGKAVEVDLGQRPFVTVAWGLYAFVPSLPALRSLALEPSASVKPPAPPPPVTSTELAVWQLKLEDKAKRQQAWQQVCHFGGGTLQTGYGRLLGSRQAVRAAFDNSGKTRLSVCGYGARMAKTIGTGYLGMDLPDWQQAHAPEVNAIIQRVTEGDAFAIARARTSGRLDRRMALAQALTRSPLAAVDLGNLADDVLADLCTHWFGIPDGLFIDAGGSTSAQTDRPTCPAHLASVSRYVFSPRPSEKVELVAMAHGRPFVGAVKSFLAGGKLGDETLTAKIVIATRDLGPDKVASTVAGIMLGFAPTVFGNLRSVIEQWVPSRRLLLLQQALHDRRDDPPHDRAAKVLRDEILGAMLARPVPDMLWRKQLPADGEKPTDPDVVIGIISATVGVRPRDSDHYLLFGGKRGEGGPLHACPGYEMALGVMLGFFSAVLEYGILRSTGTESTTAVIVAKA